MIGMFRTRENSGFKALLFFFSLFTCQFILGQLKNNSFSFFSNPNRNEISHSSIKPFLETYQIFNDTNSKSKVSQWKRKFFDESLLLVCEDQVRLTTDPLFNFSVSPKKTMQGYLYSSNVRGFRITGDLTTKLSFETRFYENQFFYPDYLSQKALLRAENENTIDAIAFGIGRAKKFKEDGIDAGLANGYVSFSPAKGIVFQLGHGRHFFGDGYRSLLLSDYAPDYQYLSGQYHFFDGKLLYKHVHSRLYNLSRIPVATTPESMLIPKSFGFNQLSFQATSALSFSLFEGTVFKAFNANSGTSTPHFSYYFPVMGSHFLAKDSLSSNSTLYGVNSSYKLTKGIKFFTQFAVRSASKIGAQFGIRNEFSIDKRKTISFLNLEYNYVPTAMYAVDSNNQFQQVSHMGHELAHPLGSGFSEWVIKGQINYGRLFCRIGNTLVKIDRPGNNQPFANQVFTSNDLIEVVNKSNLINLNNSIGFLINTATRMEISIGHLSRSLDGVWDNYLFFSFRTYLKNDYFDQ